tara:strand:- start:1418 stop:1897 length:480 start_codon:yes stop_codon:yes gene_type:complete
MKQSAGKFKKIGSLIEPLLKANMPDWRQNQNHIFSLWPNLVGEKISRKSKPDRLKISRHGDGNILFIQLLGPFGPEISLQVEEIKEKINLYYGSNFISKVVFSPTLYNNVGQNSNRQKEEKNNSNKMINNNFQASFLNKKLMSALTNLKGNLVQLEKKK